MRGPEGRGRHAQRMTRPQRPESWRLQRVGVGEGWGAGVGKPSWLPEMTLFHRGLPNQFHNFWEDICSLPFLSLCHASPTVTSLSRS